MHQEEKKLRDDLLRARYVETLGVILIAVLIFLITLIRFARTISWRVR